MDPRYTPTTDEVRGIWNSMVGNTESFERWLYAERERVWNMMSKIERDSERKRIIEVLDKETRHYASTHYAGKQCQWCDIFLKIEGENK